MAGGRPLKFATPEELAEKAEAYFQDRIIAERPITISGLALWLGTTRELLCNYEQRDEFYDTVKAIKLRAEEYAEEQLYIGRNSSGPIFALKNFGWKDKSEVDTSLGGNGNPIEHKFKWEE